MLLALAAVLLLFEEWGWRPLTAMAAFIASWPPLARLEAAIRRAPRWLALVLFAVPAVLLFPVKLLALWLIGEGRATLGVIVIVVAKVVGTALVGRLFVLVERQLMEFAWFARGIGWWRATRARILAKVRQSALWRGGRVMRRAARRWLDRLGAWVGRARR